MQGRTREQGRTVPRGQNNFIQSNENFLDQGNDDFNQYENGYDQNEIQNSGPSGLSMHRGDSRFDSQGGRTPNYSGQNRQYGSRPPTGQNQQFNRTGNNFQDQNRGGTLNQGFDRQMSRSNTFNRGNNAQTMNRNRSKERFNNLDDNNFARRGTNLDQSFDSQDYGNQSHSQSRRYSQFGSPQVPRRGTRTGTGFGQSMRSRGGAGIRNLNFDGSRQSHDSGNRRNEPEGEDIYQMIDGELMDWFKKPSIPIQKVEELEAKALPVIQEQDEQEEEKRQEKAEEIAAKHAKPLYKLTQALVDQNTIDNLGNKFENNQVRLLVRKEEDQQQENLDGAGQNENPNQPIMIALLTDLTNLLRSPEFGFDNEQVEEIANKYLVTPQPKTEKDSEGNEVEVNEDESIKYFSIEKLQLDLQEAQKEMNHDKELIKPKEKTEEKKAGEAKQPEMSKPKACLNVIDIFKMLIRSLTLWGAPLLEGFRNCNTKKPRRATRKNFADIITKYTHLNSIDDSYLDSLFQLMDPKGEKTINYLLFYEYYLAYANRQTLINLDHYQQSKLDPEHKRLSRIYEGITEFKESNKKSTVGVIFAIIVKAPKDISDSGQEDLNMHVQKNEFYSRLPSVAIKDERNRKQFSGFSDEENKRAIEADLIVTQADNRQILGLLNIIKLQERLGVSREQPPEKVSQQDMRTIAEQVQMNENGITLQKVREALGQDQIIKGNRKIDTAQQQQLQQLGNALDERSSSQYINVEIYQSFMFGKLFAGSQDPEIEDLIYRIEQSHKGLGSRANQNFDAGKFVGALDKELNKLMLLEKLYLKVKIELGRKKGGIDQNNLESFQQGTTDLATFVKSKFSEEFKKDKTKEVTSLTHDEFKKFLAHFDMMIDESTLETEDDGNEDLDLYDLKATNKKQFDYFIDEYDSSDSKEVQIEDLSKDLQNFAGSGGIFAGQGGVLNRIQVKFFKIIREFAQIIQRTFKECLQDAIEEMDKKRKKDNRTSEKRSTRKNQSSFDTNQNRVRVVHSYDFVYWMVQTVWKEIQIQHQLTETLDLDLLNIFIDTMCTDPNKRSMVVIDDLVTNYVSVLPDIQQQENNTYIDEAEADEEKQELKLHESINYAKQLFDTICDVAESQNFKPQKAFDQMVDPRNNLNTSICDIYQLQNELDQWQNKYNLKQAIAFDNDKLAILYDKTHDDFNNVINSQFRIGHFINDLDIHYRSRKKRRLFFIDFKKQFDTIGTTLEESIKVLKNRKLMSAIQLKESDFMLLAEMNKFEITNLKKQVHDVFETIPRDEFDEINAQDLLNIYDHVTAPKSGGQVVKAKHYFRGDIDRILTAIAEDIVERKMLNFGEFLIGCQVQERVEMPQYVQGEIPQPSEYRGTGNITRQAFYTLLKQTFGDMGGEQGKEHLQKPYILGSGDILDLIKYFFGYDTQTISIISLKDKMNEKINSYDSTFAIILQEREVEEKIVEPLSFRERTDEITEKQQKFIPKEVPHWENAPPNYKKKLLVEILCSRHLQFNQFRSLSECLQNQILYGFHQRLSDSELSKQDWLVAMKTLDISGQDWEFEEIYEYLQLKDAVMRSNGRSTFENKEPLNNPTLHISKIVNCLLSDLENNKQETVDAIYNVIARDIAKQVSEQRLPIEENCAMYDNGQQNIQGQQFANQILKLALGQDFPQNTVQFIINKLIPHTQQPGFINFGVLLQDIKSQAAKHNFKLYLTQQEKIDFNEQQKQKSAKGKQLKATKKKAQIQKEPFFNVCRTQEKNTWFNGTRIYQQQTKQLMDTWGETLNFDPDGDGVFDPMTWVEEEIAFIDLRRLSANQKANLEDVIKQTRIRGQTVEYFLQKFGHFDPEDGQRYLSKREFQQALVELDIEWVQETASTQDQRSKFDEIFEFIDEGSNKGLQKGKVLLENFGNIFANPSNTSINLDIDEANALIELHKVLRQKELIDNMLELFNFFNFGKDARCRHQDMMDLLVEKLGLKSGFIKTEKIQLLLNRYADYNHDDGQIEYTHNQANFKGKHVDNSIFWYDFLRDLEYQHRAIGVKDQWAAEIAEDMVKSYQVKLCTELGKEPLSDDQVELAMQTMFKNLSRHGDTMTMSDFEQICSYISMFDTNGAEELEGFFKITSLPNVGDAYQFKSNSLAISNIPISQAPVSFEKFQIAFSGLSNKQLSYMYQEVIERIYIASKKLQVSIQGPRIRHMFDAYKPNTNTGRLPINNFVEAIEELISEARYEGDGNLKVVILRRDIEFLACKYVSVETLNQHNPENVQVFYSEFLANYAEIEQQGLGGGMNPLGKNQNSDGRMNIKAYKQRIETIKIFEQLSPKAQKLYDQMSQFFRRNALQHKLTKDFVDRDEDKQGYLPKNQIREGINLVLPGKGISTNQLDILTDELKKNFSKEISYIEIIMCLFGEDHMKDTVRDYSINVTVGMEGPSTEVQDVSNLALSVKFKDQLEMRIQYLNSTVQAWTSGKMQLIDQQVFKLFKECRVSFNTEDLDVLQTYLRLKKDKDNMIFWEAFLREFDIRSETCELLNEIIKFFDDNQVNLDTFSVEKYFKKNELAELIKRAGFNIAASRLGIYDRLFDQMSERRADISKQTLKMIFDSNKQDKKDELLRKSQRKKRLPQAPYCVYEFIDFVLNKRIKIVPRFPEAARQGKITISEFTGLLEEVDYKMSKATDRAKLIGFFLLKTDSNQPKQSAEEQKFMDFKLMLAYIRQKDPTYGLEKVQGAADGLSAQVRAKSIVNTYPHHIKVFLNKINDYLKDTKISKVQLFHDLDANKNGYVDYKELETYFCNPGNNSKKDRQPIQGVTEKNIADLFKFLDQNGDGVLSVNEICLLLQGIELSLQDRLNSFSAEFELHLRQQIEIIFLELDKDKNGWLTKHELVKMFTPQAPDNGLSMLKAEQALIAMDQNSDGRLSKLEFVEFVLKRQKLAILTMEDGMEDMRALYQEQIISQTENGRNSSLTLNVQQLKQLVIKGGYSEVTDNQVKEMFAEMDSNQNGEIDIDEYMAFIYSADKVQTKTQSSRDTVFHIRSKSLKLNQLDILKLFNTMPASFHPSFSQKELEKRRKNLPSSTLLPKYDHTKLEFKDIGKLNQYLPPTIKNAIISPKTQQLEQINEGPKLALEMLQDSSPLSGQEFVVKYRPKQCLEVTLDKENLKGICLPKQSSGNPITHCEVRVALFDMAKKIYLSNFVIVGAKPVKDKNVKAAPASGQEMTETFSLELRPELKSFIATSDKLDANTVELLFEMVAYCEVGAGKDKYQQQIAVAWTSLQFAEADPKKVKTHNLPLQGGSPFDSVELADNKQQEQSKGFFQKMLGSNSNSKSTGKTIKVTSKPFQAQNDPEKLQISALPENTVILSSLLSFGESFRVHQFKQLVKDNFEMKAPTVDLTITQFDKIYDNPDLQAVIAEVWPQIAQNQKNPHLELKEDLLENVISKLYTLMYKPEMHNDHVYKTRTTPVGSAIYQIRRKLAKDILLSGQQAIKNNENLDPNAQTQLDADTKASMAFFEDFKPFSVSEFGTMRASASICGLDQESSNKQDELQALYAQMGLNL